MRLPVYVNIDIFSLPVNKCFIFILVDSSYTHIQNANLLSSIGLLKLAIKHSAVVTVAVSVLLLMLSLGN